jgi:RNA polymerase sigma-70 factor (ECF subfamily)
MTMTLTPTTRASLLFRLRDFQDHEAWVEFVEIYEPVIYRQLRKCGLQDADARELMQEFFIAVSRRIEHWDLAKDRGSFRGWLRRVTHNMVINWLKHGQRRMIAFGDEDTKSLLRDIAAEDCPESIALNNEIRRSIFQRASELVRQEQSPKAWQAFWSTTLAGKTPAVAAQELGMSVGAVRVAKCRVLARLKEVVVALENKS